MKIFIETSGSCHKCPCYVAAATAIGKDRVTFHLCRTFGRVLATSISGYVEVKKIERCAECEDAEKMCDAY